MSDVIKLLPDSVANQIAAGEVIQRPASVIKELVENAIDAEATEVSIILKDAGRTLIQVVDNGKGMSATDARLAFERHSTSKIRKADDLFALHTMGFRGEALASIAAIAQVELRTARKEDQIGSKMIISASKCESQEPDMCQVGSCFSIKNLFFNVPARRKFLKSNQVELSNILKEFEKLALVNHRIDFSLNHNDTVLYQLLGGSLKQRIIDLFGRSLDMQLIPLNLDTSLIKIEGFISKPENARKRNYLQFFFVNGRYMRHPYFHKAIMSSYEELIPAESQPNYFLNFIVEPETIDVNIHPTKTEIKFENEAPIWQIISAAVKEALGKFSVVPSIDFDTEDAPEIPVFSNSTDVEKPKIEFDPTYNPFSTGNASSKSAYKPSDSPAIKNWDILYDNFTKSKIENSEFNQTDDDFLIDVDSKAESYISSSIFDAEDEQTKVKTYSSVNTIQIKGRYILSAISSGMMIVDQHRAHVKILYDKYLKQFGCIEIVSQSVMFPIVLNLTPSQSALMEEISDSMNAVGFNLSQLSGNDWSVNGVPTGLEQENIKDAVFQVLDEVNDGGNNLSSKLYEKIAFTVAKSGAIPYGKQLSNAESEKLLEDLLALPEPNYTPDGKKIIAIMNLDQLKKMF